MARILMLLRPDRGGVFNHVARISEALADRGHEVAICGPLAHRTDDLPVAVIPLEIAREVSPLSHVRSIAGFARVARQFEPDLIHAHGSQGGAIARLARIAAPTTPVIFTPHLYAFDNYFIRGGQRVGYKLIERVLAPLATRVLCVCEAERQLASEVGPKGRTRVVYNGIDPVALDRVHPVVQELAATGPVICSIAEFRVSKGLMTLIDAMPRVLERHPDCQLVIAGDGEQRNEIERRINELGVGHAVRLLGPTDGPAGVLGGAFAFVNPAYAEAFPYTIIEAMSVGLPIIATDVGGTNEAIDDGVSGLLVPPHNPDALAESIVTLLNEPEVAREMGRNAQCSFKERFTLERMIEGTLAVYTEFL